MASPSVTLINVLKLESGRPDDLIELLKHNIENVVSHLQGWKGTRLVASADGNSVIIHSEWESLEAVEAMRGDPRMQAYFPRISAWARIESFAGAEVFAQTPQRRHHATGEAA
ncbi:putative quinol monooxygenase [Dyella jiangningensis]|nr:antibiotic biosynthesis monooxygenase [Dyella jiangningensis]